MEEKKSLFKSFDKLIFKQVENYLTTPSFQQLYERFSSMDEDLQKIINQVCSILAVLVPIFIVSFLYFKNVQTRKTLDVKKNIFKLINEFTMKKNNMMTTENKVISSSLIPSQKALLLKIKKIANQKGIPDKNIKIANFTQVQPSASLNQSNSDLLFSNLSAKNLRSFLSHLVNNEKIKIAQIKVEKDKLSKLLKGKIHIIHFGRTKK